MGDVKRILSIGGSGLVGAIVAVLADLMQKDVASAVLRMGAVLGDTLQTPHPSVVAMVVVITLAVAVCFIFQCDTTMKAFYTGASILTILMTAVPYKPPQSANTDPNKLLSPPPAVRDGALPDLLGPATVFAQPEGRPSPPVPVKITLTSDDGKPVSDVLVTLRDPKGHGIIARSKLSGSPINLYPAPGRYVLMVEVSGYRIAEREINLQSGLPLQVDLRLESTWTPLPIQRLFKY